MINKPFIASYILVFTLDKLMVALPTNHVDRTIPMVEITPLPNAPGIVLGVINLYGNIIPVVNLRERFRLKEREPDSGDKIIIAHSNSRKIGIIVDSVKDVIEFDETKMVPPERIIQGIEQVEGVLKLQDGLIIIHDINKFLSIEEEHAIDNAVSGVRK
ncbi:MAG: chemotaxis protein CheW [Nitrospira sp.]|nr:chemotaxis protein CheW [Nitrospira sp.]